MQSNSLKNGRVSIALLVLLSAGKINAQTHTNTWFRTTVIIPAKDHFSVSIETQKRQQNGFENQNPFEKNLLFSIRTWFQYKQNENVVYAVSPFAWFSNYKIIQKQTDEKASPVNEYRLSAAMEIQQNLVSKLFIVNRPAFEYRLFEGNLKDIIRLRDRLSFRYDLNAKTGISIGNEIFINAAGTDIQHIFDHNRIFTNATYKPKPLVKFDLGYIYISRLPKNDIERLEENNFYLNLTYILPTKSSH